MDSYVQTLAVNGEVHLLAKAADSSVFALRACHFLLKKGEGTAYEELRYPELQKVHVYVRVYMCVYICVYIIYTCVHMCVYIYVCVCVGICEW